jgi:hypothetical protein
MSTKPGELQDANQSLNAQRTSNPNDLLRSGRDESTSDCASVRYPPSQAEVTSAVRACLRAIRRKDGYGTHLRAQSGNRMAT